MQSVEAPARPARGRPVRCDGQQDPPVPRQLLLMLVVIGDGHPVLFLMARKRGSSASRSSRIWTVPGIRTARKPVGSSMSSCARGVPAEDRVLHPVPRGRDVEPLAVPVEPVRAQLRAPVPADPGDDGIWMSTRVTFRCW